MSQRTRKTKGRKAVEKQASKPNTMLLILGGVGTLAVLILGWNLISSATDSTARELVSLDYDSPSELLAMAQPVSRGSADAPIVMMDFSDYSCPACQHFATRVKPTVNRVYVDPGLIRFDYYDFPPPGMFPNSFTAARAARCAGDQNSYWPFHDQLYQNQARWSTQSDPVRTFEGYAEDLGLDRGDFRSCLRSDRHAEVVTANLLLGQQLGVTGTPTVLLNTGEGAPVRVDQFGDVSAVRAQVDDALERGGHLEPDEVEAEEVEGVDDPETQGIRQ